MSLRHRPVIRGGSLAAAFAAIMLATGCAGGMVSPMESPATMRPSAEKPSPSPSETVTAFPEPSGPAAARTPDPRCVRQFGARAIAIDEAEAEGRPDFWPAVPEWAALCFTEWENEFTQVAWYATDAGISRAEIYRTYEYGMSGVGVAGRTSVEGQEVVTGTVAPNHSFWIVAERDQYRVTWAFDGEYAD